MLYATAENITGVFIALFTVFLLVYLGLGLRPSHGQHHITGESLESTLPNLPVLRDDEANFAPYNVIRSVELRGEDYHAYYTFHPMESTQTLEVDAWQRALWRFDHAMTQLHERIERVENDSA